MRTIKIENQVGIHARPASQIVTAAKKFDCEVFLVKAGKEYSAKSIMNILSMAIVHGDVIGIRAHGANSEEAVNYIYELFAGINH
ncbi:MULTISPECIES: HPr family phosphocarrier protein [unclassified Fusibacter]|uniref:HPr family phosphocarrier protein n=1 Tax=unclassified Fusibacter TaxID=2624464 RepID=UPI00101342F9|nr:MULTISPECIES: HPr family phosphocarrier protein [unclassified Fusibacter]MCK8061327.1 HPr family phosphocarrier protein [Fusibacter sp. A2]NPE23476.1 HPr family phosphocarrier protein [Fusibacter sp. A1]RXV59082.1 HPr family phosphocarrier protein [Fusibacter sp. A1]